MCRRIQELISQHEATRLRVIHSGPQIIQAVLRVTLFAGVAEWLGAAALTLCWYAELVRLIGLCHIPGIVTEYP